MTERVMVTAARRIVVKVGSSSLTTAAGGIDPERVRALCDVLVKARGRGTEVVLVSSGAIASALAPLGLKKRPRGLAAQQAAASVGQGLLVHRYTEELARHGVITGQILLTLDDLTRRAHHRNAHQTMAKLFEMGVLPIVNENDTVATNEIRFGDNDRLAALVAHLVHADLLLLLSDVDGLYDGPPQRKGTSLIGDVRSAADLDGVTVGSVGKAGVGTGGMATKVEAAGIATDSGIPVVLTSAENADAALAGGSVGTLFHPIGRRKPIRLTWLRHATDTKGAVTLDDGAVRAVTERRASLLAAGITAVEGSFGAGDPIELQAPDGTVVARGLVNYDASELPALLGRSSRDLKRDLGSGYEREVVHRDDIVLL